MGLDSLSRCAVIAVVAGFLSACGEGGMSPTSPSVTSRASQDAPRSATNFSPRRVDEDGDGYEDPESGPMPDPGTVPPPNPDQVPPPEGMPAPEGIPVPPVQLTINVVGTFGTGAFAPNPLQAAIGNTIVWMNNDVVPHDIVLDNGTLVGNIAPGQSSMPIPLATETVSYRCTFHPSMTGQIVPVQVLPPGEPLPPSDPSQIPAPDPSGTPAPPDPYGDEYDDGYEDDYY
jgi:plastocyanin